MAYEYEIKIPMWLEDGRWLNMNVDDEVLDELEEVYRKAKAFDEVIKKVKTEFVSEDLADAIRILVNDYEYDKGEPTSMSVADMQPMTELQLTKDSSVQGVPLTNEAYEKAIKEGE